MKTLVKKVSEALVNFGLNNVNNNTVITIDSETKDVDVFDSEYNSFKNKDGRFLQSFCANQFIFEVSDNVFDVNLDEIKSNTFIIE